jgi:hypothetical protein
MNDQIEFDLREALRARAAQVPAAAAVRLAGLDYRPRTRRLRPPVAIGAVASAAVAVGALVVVISLGAGASNAFAGWSAKPTKAAPGQLAAAQAACRRSQSPVDGLPLALADTRGPFTFAVYADSESTATCIQGPGFVSLSVAQGTAPVSVPADRVQLAGAHSSDRGGHLFGFAYGRTGSGVSAVTLVLADGSQVQATVTNGWFVAWWPSDQQLKSAQLTTAAGTSTQAFDLPTHGLCNTNKDCGSQQSSNVGGGPGGKGSGYSRSQ